jgi:hypothetical protein
MKPRRRVGNRESATQVTYINQLLAAGTDEAACNAVHRALDKDKGVSKAAADAIAHGYTRRAVHLSVEVQAPQLEGGHIAW